MPREEEEIKLKIKDVHKKSDKIKWGKLHKVLKEITDEEKEEFKKNPRAYIEKKGVSLPADVEVHAIDFEEGRVHSPPDPGARFCLSLCWFFGGSIGWDI